MVTSIHTPARRQGGWLMLELLVAISLLLAAVFPLAYTFHSEQRLARSYYLRAVAMEIVDGEMETLAAGEWKSFPPGTHDYAVKAAAATNLPPGRFLLTVDPGKVRLQWLPAIKQHGGPVTREAAVK